MRLHIAWQKVTNKNSNELLRELFQKRQNLPYVRENIKKDPALINARPKENISPQNTHLAV